MLKNLKKVLAKLNNHTKKLAMLKNLIKALEMLKNLKKVLAKLNTHTK